ncbi:hypothetical protein GCM10011611_09060 [Aliidongia dinghuensis]|uniref:Murein transglycosylase n=2 Tax=Aliidongia dinghuensis TaxID=1867774 RepID=A0A8J2YRD1_9PROT|nr:hypothetical protein GCM10011611_09060 [Aliidongia dinghuensis]
MTRMMFRGTMCRVPMRGMVEVRRAAVGVVLLSGLAACAGSPPGASTAPVSVAAPQSAAANYAPPGPPNDPWGPYIHEASTRFSVPEKWIREVMRQESGGREYINGGLTTSSVGAMGLMQLMPVTYAEMRDRYGLGPDPYAPHDNILAGTAYIREMYARYGSPGFLAAYNAGPGRLESYLYGATPLPAETVGYLTSVAPRLGDDAAPSGPLAHYAMAETSSDSLNARSLAGTLPASSPQPVPAAPAPATGAVQMASYQVPPPDAPSGDLYRELQAKATRAPIESSPLAAYAPPAPPPKPQPQQARVVLAAATAPALAPGGSWAVQVGAFSTAAQAQTAAADARSRARGTLDRAQPSVATVNRPSAPAVYRAQLVGLSADGASDACSRLAHEHVACIVVAPHGSL